MSAAAQAWAFQQKVGDQGAKLVLWSLADHADKEGVCWPSFKLLAAETEMSERNAIRKIAVLVEKGLIVKASVGGGRKSNRYQLSYDNLTPLLCQPVTAALTPVSQEPVVPVQVVVSTETTPAQAEAKPRKIDPLWDALIAAKLPAPQTKNERGRWNVALKQLREASVDAQEIPAICGAFRKKWPLMTLTPTAIASNLSLLRPDPARRVREWSDADLAAADERRNQQIQEALGETIRARGSREELPTIGVAPEVRELRGRRPAGDSEPAGGRRDDASDGAVPLLLEGLAGGVSGDRSGAEEGPLGFRGLLAGPGNPNGVAAPLEAESAAAARGEHPPDERAA